MEYTSAFLFHSHTLLCTQELLIGPWTWNQRGSKERNKFWHQKINQQFFFSVHKSSSAQRSAQHVANRHVKMWMCVYELPDVYLIYFPVASSPFLYSTFCNRIYLDWSKGCRKNVSRKKKKIWSNINEKILHLHSFTSARTFPFNFRHKRGFSYKNYVFNLAVASVSTKWAL